MPVLRETLALLIDLFVKNSPSFVMVVVDSGYKYNITVFFYRKIVQILFINPDFQYISVCFR